MDKKVAIRIAVEVITIFALGAINISIFNEVNRLNESITNVEHLSDVCKEDK